MARVHRSDTVQLAAPTRRADGTLIVEAKLARTGVYTYRDSNYPGGFRREYRGDAEVFSPRAMDSFRLVPFTLDHPPVKLTSENAAQYAKGAVGENIRRDGKWLVGTIAVFDKSTIDAMESGAAVEVSNGYDCELVMKPGVSPDGEHFDCYQTAIEGNHVAAVARGRASLPGDPAVARMDSLWSTGQLSHTDKEPATMNLEQALAALAAANNKIGEQTAQLATVTGDRDAQKSRADKLEAERDDFKSRLDKAEVARKDAVDGVQGKVRARVALESGARRVLGSRCDAVDGKPAAINLDALDERAIKLAVIKHVTDADCDVDASGAKRSDDYVNARYDAAVERAAASAETHRELRTVIDTGRSTDASGKSRRDAARDEMIQANRGLTPPAPAAK